ncbi:MAG: hypothetical protein ABI873_08600 [Marmoricola sp.]
MWLDENRVLQTNAFARPGTIMGFRFRRSLSRLARESGDGLRSFFDGLLDEHTSLAAEMPYAAATEQQFEGEWLTFKVTRRCESMDSLGELVASIDIRWRLDVIFAMQEYLDAPGN